MQSRVQTKQQIKCPSPLISPFLELKSHIARKTIFPRSWNIIESSKRPRKYNLSINFLAEKTTVFLITEKFKTRTSQ